MVKRSLSLVFNICTALFLYATSPSGTLPVMYVNTAGGQPITGKDDYVAATCWIDPGDTDVPALGSSESPVGIGIRGRGNYTWTGFDKKPYKIKFDAKSSPFGWNKNRHFALLAHADDNTGFLRNICGMELSRRVGLAWTPDEDALELVVNGDYKGLYFLTETIRVDADRVRIFEMDDGAIDDVTGGWLVEIDNYDTDPHVAITEGNGQHIIFTYKTPEVLSPQQEAYLRDNMKKLDEVIYGEKNSPELARMLDLDEAARYYVVQELMDDCESYHGSCYLYKDHGDDAKWSFGPVWDFGNAFSRGEKNKFIWQDPQFNQTWIGELYKHSAFRDKVKEVWRNFCDNGLSDLGVYLHDYVARYSVAAVSDSERWPEYGNAAMVDKLNAMVDKLNKSAAWLGRQWGYTAPKIELLQPEVQIYVRGDFNGWGVANPMTKRADGTWIATHITDTHGRRFKIASADWVSADFGANDEYPTITVGQPYALKAKGVNIQLPRAGTDMTVIFNPDAETLLLADPAGVTDVTGSTDEPAQIFSISGVRVDRMDRPGLYIIRSGSQVTKVAWTGVGI